MPWYKTGTVSVVKNSNAVIGSGTAFIANSRVGDAFRGPDGGWYEVTNIASDTAMSIAPNYQGATNSAGAYALAPMQGYVKDSADALRALVNQFGGVIAVLGNTPTLPGVRTALNLTNADGLPDGDTNKYLTNPRVLGSVLAGLSLTTSTPIVATDTVLAALGKLQASKAGKGANGDITSLTGLTTALSVAQGGTAGTTQAAARTGLGLGAAAIVDVVGLMANNAIIEKGSNASGNWTKFFDGTMICTLSYAIVINITTVYGAVFYGAVPSLAFSQTFFANPSLSYQVKIPGGGGWLGRDDAVTTGATGGSIIVSPVSRPSQNVVMDYIAVGRWKA
jgi:hypothetical protein